MPALLALTLGFSGGVFLATLGTAHTAVFLFLCALTAVCVVAQRTTGRAAYFLIALAFAAGALGTVRMRVGQEKIPPRFSADLRHRETYTGTVVGNPDVRDTTQRVIVRLTNGTDHAKALVVTKRYPILTVGDSVRVTGTLLQPNAFRDADGRVFHYDKYLEKEGVLLEMDFASVHFLESAPWYNLPALLSRAKRTFLRGIADALPEPYASFAGGIVIGGKSGLGDALESAFVRSGLVQIIVLSGYNVMVVAEWVMLALQSLRASRRVSALFGAGALLVFVGIAGFSATALRATLMALIALYARATGRSYTAGRALLVTIVLMVLYSPLSLVYDPGFALSVAATAGIIWLAPLFENKLACIKNSYWKNALATTLSAQVAVLPLLLYETGNLSFVSIPANLAVIAVMPLAMAAAALAGVGGVVFGSVFSAGAVALGMPAYLLSAYCIWVARTSAALPWSAALVPTFPFIVVVLAYALLLFYAMAANRSVATFQFTLAKNASR